MEVGAQFSKQASNREYLWVRLHKSLNFLVYIYLKFLLLFLLFLAMFAIGVLKDSCKFHLSNDTFKVCCVNVNLEPTVDHLKLSVRDKFGARLQHFFDTKFVCGGS